MGFSSKTTEISFYQTRITTRAISEVFKAIVKSITKLEVIDESGRVYVYNECKIELSYQDDGRTLKIFVKNKELNNDK